MMSLYETATTKRTNIYVTKQKTEEQLAYLIITLYNFCICTLQLIAIHICIYTVGPRLSESPLSETSVIRTLF